jgi:hypothetical protein
MGLVGTGVFAGCAADLPAAETSPTPKRKKVHATDKPTPPPFPHHAKDARGWRCANRFHTVPNSHNERMLPRRRQRLPIERPDRLPAAPETVLRPITSASESMLLPPTIIRSAPDTAMPVRPETYRRPTAGLGKSLRVPLTTRCPGAIDKESEICGYYTLRRGSPQLR